MHDNDHVLWWALPSEKQKRSFFWIRATCDRDLVFTNGKRGWGAPIVSAFQTSKLPSEGPY